MVNKMEPDHHPDKFLTIDEAAALLRVHPATIRRWAHEGLIPIIKIKQTIRIRKSDIDELIKPMDRIDTKVLVGNR